MIKVIAAFGRGCTASACLLVNKKKQFEGDNGGGRGSGAIPYTTYWSLAAILTTLVQSPVNYIMLLSIYKPCVAIAYICRTQWWQYIDVDCFLLEAEMTLAQYRIIYTDYLEFATNPAQRLITMVYIGSSPFAACSYRVEVGYVLNKLNKLHQCGCDIPLRRLSNYIRTLSSRRCLPNNTIFLESVTDSVTTRRNPYTDCVPTLWSPTNLVTWCHHKYHMVTCTESEL